MTTDVEKQLQQAREVLWDRPGEAIALYRTVIEHADGATAADVRRELAEYYFGQGELQRAIEHARAATQSAAASDVTRGRCAVTLANAALSLGEPLDPTELRRGIDVCIATGHKQEAAIGLVMLGKHNYRAGDHVTGIADTQLAVELYEQVGREVGRGIALGNLAEFALADGQVAVAVEYLDRAIEGIRKMPLRFLHAREWLHKLVAFRERVLTGGEPRQAR